MDPSDDRTPGVDGRSRDRASLVSGAYGALLFVCVFALESLWPPPGYHPLRHTVSAFVLGPFGWVQRVSFVAADPAAAGATTDFPYPPGQPVDPARTVPGILHDLSGTPVFLGLPILAAATGYRFARARHQRWAAYSITVAVVFLAGFVLTSLALAQPPRIVPLGGLLQRLTLAVGFTWLAAFALRLRSTTT